MNRIRMLRSMTAAVSVAVVMVAFATPAAAAPAPDPLWVATDDDPFVATTPPKRWLSTR